MNRQASLDITTSSADRSASYGSQKRRCSADETSSRFNLVSPFGELLSTLRDEATRNGIWCDELQRDLPKRWEKHGDLIIFPPNCFKHRSWRLLGRRLWQLTAQSLKAERLGRKRVLEGDEFHTPHVDLLYGKDGWVEHVDSGVRYHYDVTKRMFNIGNVAEKKRIWEMNCHQDVVVDMFAGIGYFTLAYLMGAEAKHVYAIDWYEDAIEALRRTLESNGMTKRCTVIQGDARKVAPQGVADRVNLGLVPSAHPYWLAGCRCLKPAGGILHVHEAVKLASSSNESRRPVHQLRRLHQSGSNLSSLIRTTHKDSSNCRTALNRFNHPNHLHVDIWLLTLMLVPYAFSYKNASLGSVSETSELSEHGDADGKSSVDQNDDVVTFSTGQQTSEVNSEKTSNDSSDDQPERKLSNGSVEKSVARKISRSASIIDEIENRILPNARVEPEFKANKWTSFDVAIREFAIDCATSCTRYLNNIHDEQGKVWTCMVVNIVKVKSYPGRTEHIVVDLDCRPEQETTALTSDLNEQTF